MTDAWFEEVLGPDWRDLTREEALTRLQDAQARETAERDQARAEYAEMRAYNDALGKAMVERGARYVSEVADDVARDLYGGHTPATRRVLEGIARVAAADPRTPPPPPQ